MPSLIDSRYNFAKRSLFAAGVSSASSSPLSLGSTSSALRSMSSKSDPLPPECKSSSTVRFFPCPFADTRPLLVRSIFLLEDGPESSEDTRFRFRVFLEEKNESGIAPGCVRDSVTLCFGTSVRLESSDSVRVRRLRNYHRKMPGLAVLGLCLASTRPTVESNIIRWPRPNSFMS